MSARASTLSLLIFYSMTCFSQNAKVGRLRIGDTLPDVELKMINYKNEKARLSDFKGKLLILDFWSTWCTSCIAAFPHMEKLQKEFGDRIMILPVTSYGSKEYNQAFFEKRKRGGHAINLPSAVEANFIVDSLFPPNGIPQEVWINEKGLVLGVTDQFPVTEIVIQRILNGEKVYLPIKPYSGLVDNAKPLLIDNNGGPDSAFMYRSIITSYNPNLWGSGPYFSDYGSSKKWLRISNSTIAQLLKTAVSNYDTSWQRKLEFDRFNKRIIILSKDSVKWKDDINNNETKNFLEIEKQNQRSLFCYELIVPNSFSREQAYFKMYEDLSSFFNLAVSFEKRKTQCLALIQTSDKKKLSNSKNRRSELSETGAYYIKEGISLEELVIDLNNNCKTCPIVIDETGYKDKLDFIDLISENISKMPLQEIRIYLHKYDLDLIPVERTLDTLVFKSKKMSL